MEDDVRLSDIELRFICSACGNPVSKSVWTCPRCGRDRYRVVQRQVRIGCLIILGVVFAVVVFLIILGSTHYSLQYSLV